MSDRYLQPRPAALGTLHLLRELGAEITEEYTVRKLVLAVVLRVAGIARGRSRAT